MQILLKALFMSAFLLPIYGCNAQESCNPPSSLKSETAKVKWVHDGDTIWLHDKRKIRIIGIDTPERKQKHTPAEPYSGEAREALRELFKKHNYQVTLHYGEERKDRYKRTLAHIVLPDNTNVSAWLLSKGLATTLSYPPNTKLAKCYKKIEKQAQKENIKIWSLSSHQEKDISELADQYKGYIRLKAPVKNIHWNKKTIGIELQSKSRRPILVVVKRKNIRYFESLRFNKLINQHIIVSGMLKNRRGNRMISLNHPSQLEILTEHSLTEQSNDEKDAASLKWSLQK